jgi:hypothetical protein
MESCVTTVHAWNTVPWVTISWWYTCARIPQFLSRPFKVSCQDFTQGCIAKFSSEFQMLSGHLILSMCQTYPLSPSTHSPGSRKWRRALLNILMLLYLPAGQGPWIQTKFPARMSTPTSYLSADFPACLSKAKAFPLSAAPC